MTFGTHHETKQDAIDREIIPALGDWVHDFDVEGIADQVIETIGTGTRRRFVCAVDVPTFWVIVQQHERPARSG